MGGQMMRNMGARMDDCQVAISYRFTDETLCLEALNASGLCVAYLGKLYDFTNNDAMAVLGDARMEAILCRLWWDTGRRNKGEWTTVRRDLLGNAALAAKGRAMGIDGCIAMHPGTSNVTDKMVTTAVEAIAGAIYVDGGEIALMGFMAQHGFDSHHLLQ